MPSEILKDVDVSYLDKELLDDEGRFIIKPSSFYNHIPHNHIRIWGNKNAIYCFTTTELIDWLKTEIDPKSTIEIGAGNSSIGRALNIPMTDSLLQNRTDVKHTYKAVGQATVNYPSDIVAASAKRAIKLYNPQTVIGAWITHKYNPNDPDREGNYWGIDEGKIIKKVKKYIVIGNEVIHNMKPIMEKVSYKYRYPWLISRAKFPDLNTIFVWEKN